MSRINVVLATDANYLPYLEITLKSLLAHNQNLSVFVMNTGDIHPEWVNSLQTYFERRSSSLNLVYLSEDDLRQFSPNGYISKATYLRFYIPKLFKFSESPYWIYLDCDVVINGDITKPFEQYHFANSALGAVSDPYVNSLRDYPYLNNDYFNAGILYLNAHKVNDLLSQHLTALSERLKDQIQFGDQDILNFYFKNDWIQLSKNYNFQLDHVLNINQSETPFIIHFTGPHKPLENITSDNLYVMSVISLFRLYNSISWEDVVNLPIGTIKLVLTK